MRRITQIPAFGLEVKNSQKWTQDNIAVRLVLSGHPLTCKPLTKVYSLLLCFIFIFTVSLQEAYAGQKSNNTSASQNDLWERLRKGFRLPGKQHQRSRTAARWYKNNPEYLTRVSKRALPFMYLVTEAVEKRKMPAEIAILPIVESAFQPYAYSSGKASGIWQFIPTTGQRFKLRQNWWYDGHKDVRESSRAALDYLQKLHRKFKGDWLLAIAAYNCGEGRVAKAIKRNRQAGRSTQFWSLKLPRETRGYVPQLLGLAKVISNPGAYGVKLTSIPNRPVIADVNTGGQIDLSLVADLAGVKLQTIYDLNPALNQWATSPNGPHQLLLPIEKKNRFKARLAKKPKNQRIHMRTYQIKSGDTLSGIANRYGVSTRAIKDVNNISGHLVAVGRKILIPKPKQKEAIYIASKKKSREAALNIEVAENERLYSDHPLYIVQPGDSLWKIGQEFKVSTKQLSSLNKIALNDRLQPGQKIMIKPPNNRLKNASSKGKGNKFLYKVRRGDSLWLISRKFKVAIKEIRVWNELPDTHYLRPGRNLIIYGG